MIGRNDPCWCGSTKKWKHCHYPQDNADGKDSQRTSYWKKYGIRIKSPEQILGIRAACLLTTRILEETCAAAKAGVTTEELNQLAHKLTLDAGAIPAPLHYGSPPYPKSICTSLNEVICHGIPDQTVLKEGDIMNVDVSCILNSYFGDCSKMVVIGKTTPEKQKLVDVSYECLMRSIAPLKPGVELHVIGDEISDYAEANGCSVVYQFVGHGVGIEFHENPQVAHSRNKSKIPLAPGMIFTIEPMINLGVPEGIIDTTDEWTCRTKDGKSSAQWEHTILITPDGYDILTPWTR